MSEIKILYPFDNNYARYAEVSIVSLLENNKEVESICIYILGFSLEDDVHISLTKTVERYNRTIKFLDETRVVELIAELGLPSYRGALIAAARLFLPYFLPELDGRLLYLDSDTIVTGDLKGLFDEDLKGNPVGMVLDSVARDYKACFGFVEEESYFNAGVILYDLDKWAENDCSQIIIDHIKHVRRNYEALDQDLINLALKGRITKLDLKYNYQPFHVRYTAKTYIKVYGSTGYYTENEIKTASENVVIHHCFRFLGTFPWHSESYHPDKKLFDYYAGLLNNRNDLSRPSYNSGIIMTIERLLYGFLPDSLYLWLFRISFRMIMKKNNRERIGDEKK